MATQGTPTNQDTFSPQRPNNPDPNPKFTALPDSIARGGVEERPEYSVQTTDPFVNMPGIEDGTGRLPDQFAASSVVEQLGITSDDTAEDVILKWKAGQDKVRMTDAQGGYATLPGTSGTIQRSDLELLWNAKNTLPGKDPDPSILESAGDVALGLSQAVGAINPQARRRGEAMVDAQIRGEAGPWQLMGLPTLDRVVSVFGSAGEGIAMMALNAYNFGSDMMGEDSYRVNTGSIFGNFARGDYPEHEIIKGITEFMVPFMSLNVTAVKNIGALQGTTMSARISRGGAQTAIAGGVAGVAMDPSAGNMADFALMLGATAGPLEWLADTGLEAGQNPFTTENLPTYLENMSEGKKRLKNALSDWTLGMPVDFLFETIGRIRYRDMDGVLVHINDKKAYQQALVDNVASKKFYADSYKELRDTGMTHDQAHNTAMRHMYEVFPPAEMYKNARNAMSELVASSFDIDRDSAGAMLEVVHRMGVSIADIEISPRGMIVKSGQHEGLILYSKTARDAGERVINKPSTQTVVDRINDNGGAKYVNRPDGPLRTNEGGKFSDLDLDASSGTTNNISFTDEEMAKLWQNSKQDSAGGEEFVDNAVAKNSQKGRTYNPVLPISADFINQALRQPDSVRYWYQVGVEDFESRLLKGFTSEETQLFFDLLVTNSAKTPVGDDLYRTLAIMGDGFASRASNVPVLSDSAIQGAKRGDPSDFTRDSYKVTNFGSTHMDILGLPTENVPLSVNDTIMAQAFGMGDAAMANGSVYESISRYVIGVRDMINERLPQGAEPYTSDQVQALMWVHQRNTLGSGKIQEFTNYAEAMDGLFSRLDDAGITYPVDELTGQPYLTKDVIKHPGFNHAIGQTAGRRSEFPVMMLEAQTKLHPELSDVVDMTTKLLHMADRPDLYGEAVSKRAMEHYQKIQKGWNNVLSSLGHKNKFGGRETTALTEISSIIRGETRPGTAGKTDPRFRGMGGVSMPSFDADGRFVGNGGTWKGEFGPNMTVPIVDMFGPESRIASDALRWVNKGEIVNPKAPFPSGKDNAKARELLGVGDDHKFTVEDMKQLSEMEATRTTNEIQEFLAVMQTLTKQEGLYASKFSDFDGSDEMVARLLNGESASILDEVDGWARPSVWIPDHQMQPEVAAKLSKAMGIDFSIERSHTGTTLTFFDGDAELIVSKKTAKQISELTGIPIDSIEATIVKVDSYGDMSLAEATAKVDELKTRLLSENIADDYLTLAKVTGVDARNSWDTLLDTPTRRTKFLQFETDEEAISFLNKRQEQIRNSIITKAEKAGGIENARLTATEQRWIEAGGGTGTNAISNVQGVASQIRSRSEYVRFTDAESTLKRQRDEAYETVRQRADDARKTAETEPINPPTPTVLKSEVDNTVRGLTVAREGERVIIGGVENPTGATALEEFAHASRLILLGTDNVSGIKAPPEMQDAFNKVFGVKPGDDIPEALDEEIASAFIMYIREGKAPSADLQPAFDLLAAQLKSSYTRASGGKPVTHLTKEHREFFDGLMTRTDLPIEYANGKFMNPIPVKDLLKTISRREAKGKDWMDSVDMRDVIARSGGSVRYGDDPDDVLKLLAAYDTLYREGRREGIIGAEMSKEEITEAGLEAWNIMMGRGRSTTAETLSAYWKSNVQVGQLATEMPAAIFAAQHALRVHLNDVAKFAEIATSGKPEDIAALIKSLHEFEKVHTVVSDIRAGWGRGGNALQQDAEKMFGSVDDLIDESELSAMGEIARLIDEANRKGTIVDLPKVVNQLIRSTTVKGLRGKSLLDDLLAYQRNNLLSRFSTWASLSVIGAPVIKLLEGVETAIGALVSGDLKTLRETFEKVLMNVSDTPSALKYAGQAFVKNDSTLMPGRHWEEIARGESKATDKKSLIGAVWSGANTIQRFPGRAMLAIDEYFRQINARSAAATRIRRNVESSIIPEDMDPNSVEARKLIRENHDAIMKTVDSEMERIFKDGKYMDRTAVYHEAKESDAITSLPPSEQGPALVRHMEETPGTGLDDKLILNEARRSTYQEDVGVYGKMFLSAIEKFPIIKFMVPFAKTATNIISRYGGYMPTAHATVVIAHMNKTFREGGLKALPKDHPLRLVHSRTLEEISSADPQIAARAKGRIITSVGIGGSIAALYLEDRLTGTGPQDPTLRKQWLQDHQPYSIKIGDEWVSYKGWTGHAGILISAWANTLESTYSGWYDDQAPYERMLYTTVHTLADQSMVTGLSNFFEATSRPEVSGSKFVGDMAWSFTPWGQGMSGATMAIDPVLKDTADFQQQYMKGFPFADNTGTAKRYNTLGEPVSLTGLDDEGKPITGGRSWYNYLMPTRIKADGDDPVFDEFMAINFRSGPPSHDFMGMDLRLMPSPSGVGTVHDDYNAFVQQPKPGMPTLRQSLEKVIKSANYQKASALSVEGLSPKAQILSRIVETYKKAGMAALLGSNPELVSNVEDMLTAEQLSAFIGTPHEEAGHQAELDALLDKLKGVRK